jgi:hypothetical protein
MKRFAILIVLLFSFLFIAGCSSESGSIGGQTTVDFQTGDPEADGESVEGSVVFRFGDRGPDQGENSADNKDQQKGRMMSAAQATSVDLINGSNMSEAYETGKSYLEDAPGVSSGKTEEEIVYTFDGFSLFISPDGTITQGSK